MSNKQNDIYNEDKKEQKEEFYLSSWYGGDTRDLRDLESNQDDPTVAMRRVNLKYACPTCGAVKGWMDDSGESVCSNSHPIDKPAPSWNDQREDQL